MPLNLDKLSMNWLFSGLGLSLLLIKVKGATRPHIVVVIADDLGWSDVGFQNQSKIQTPTIDLLSKDGILLTNHYAQPLCSPSRAALLTGKYPMRLGSSLEYGVFYPTSKVVLSEEEKLLPEYLKELGYFTALIGKWHLGSSTWKSTPTNRGFDKFFGFYNGAIDYYGHNQTDWACLKEGRQSSFLDFRNQTEPYRENLGVYSTDLFNKEAKNLILNHDSNIPLFLVMAYQNVHSPLQAPEKYINKYKKIISNEKRRVYAAMATQLDDSIKDLKRTLEDKNMWSDTIVVFFSDNGGDQVEGGYNWPLRGTKGSAWEGGTRTISFLSGGYLQKTGIKTGKSYTSIVHVSDWFPTLLHVAGYSNIPSNIDGIDFWSNLKAGTADHRTSMLYNLYYNAYAIRRGDWKLITEVDIGWAAPPESKLSNPHFSKRPTDIEMYDGSFDNASLPKVIDGLYNLRRDPFETVNLSKDKPKIVIELKEEIRNFYSYFESLENEKIRFICNFKALKIAERKNVWGPFL